MIRASNYFKAGSSLRVILPPGDTRPFLGIFVVMTGGAPGIQWVGARMLLSTPLCPGWPHRE